MTQWWANLNISVTRSEHVGGRPHYHLVTRIGDRTIDHGPLRAFDVYTTVASRLKSALSSLEGKP